MFYYAVQRGRNPGVYPTWSDCSREVTGFNGAKYKKFPTLAEAEDFVLGGGGGGGGSGESHRSQPTLQHRLSSRPTYQNTKKTRDSLLGAEGLGVVMNSDDRQVVYTDGSSLGNGYQGARAGVGVYFGPDDPRNLAERLAGELQTNQRAELTAALRALEITRNQEKTLEIRTDSKYTIDCVTKWIMSWKRNNWKTSTGGSVKNADLIKELDHMVTTRRHPVRWVHVRGHAGEYGNEQADRLANEGSRK